MARKRPWRVEECQDPDVRIWNVVMTYGTEARANARANALIIELIANGVEPSAANKRIRVEKHVDFEASR